MSNLKNFCKSIIENGGASYNLNTGEFNPDSGYFVSLYGTESVGEISSVEDMVYTFLKKNGYKLSLPSNFLGGWIDDKGNLVLDISIKINDLSKALEIGRENKQKAIYDASNKDTIYLLSNEAQNKMKSQEILNRLEELKVEVKFGDITIEQYCEKSQKLQIQLGLLIRKGK